MEVNQQGSPQAGGRSNCLSLRLRKTEITLKPCAVQRQAKRVATRYGRGKALVRGREAALGGGEA